MSVICRACIRYAKMNPIRAGLVDRAGDWEWSSARYHLGLRTTDYLVRDRDLFELVDDWVSYVRGGDENEKYDFEWHLRT